MPAKITQQRRSAKVRAAGTRLISGLALAALVGVAGSHAAQAAPAKQTISSKIAREMIAAQKALQGGKYADGLKNLQAAEAKGGLTPFDHKTIDDLKAYAYVKMNNMKGAEQAWEAALQTGAASPQDQQRFTRAVFQLSYNAKEYPKAIEYGKKMVDLGLGGADIYAVIGQSYYLTNNCKDASAYMDKAIAATRQEGKAPQEAFYQIKLRCAFNAKDTAGEIQGYSDLVRLTNKPDYWNALLRIERQNEKEDRNILMIYRLMYNTNSMRETSDYIEMAQLLGDAALPEEAQNVVQKLIASGSVAPAQQDRVNRLLKELQKRVATDKAGLASFEKEADKSPAGQLDVKMGEVYYGLGNFESAVQIINKGLAKGQVKNLGEAYVYLGLSYQALKNPAAAKKALAHLKGLPSMPDNIQKLWLLYAATLS
ncbi:MAG: hypothetical protein KGL34_08850 [Gammaproteobacteria bacterium]|nr:hypothetical protein [Gammaproteobacteria bacterium]